ncbi:sulfatase-like hydrolase/transferase [Roseiconus nitratireducens]|uniref:Sulfatase-like hydrolase/transferase n=2 Tax=Roseiconus nitratireducens TaxID=2605748 RepID=A0A5M6D6W7_9BACT|nr:sulfatase-like hydrolase/transferase [Roseiconus nitratireducens]
MQSAHAQLRGADPAKPPNIVLILTDDQGWSQLSQSMDPSFPDAKSDYLETPRMVELIHRGMRFTAGYSPAPLCTPTRRSIQCGTSAARSGPEFKSDWVPSEHLTIPKALKQACEDYRCAHFGKWGEQMISSPDECGYDASDGMTGNNTGGMPRSLGIDGGHADGPPHFIDNVDPKRSRSITTSAIEFMRQSVDTQKPFYVQVSYYAQHLSVVTSDALLTKYQQKGTPDRAYTPAWAAMMEELDTNIGRLLDTIDGLSIDKETYVFLTADNGGRGSVPGGDAGRPETNRPLTGAKHSLYEGGVRVPFVAAGPRIPAGSVCRVPVVGYDFLPTFYEIADGDPKRLPQEIDGASILELLRDPNAKPPQRSADAIIFHRPNRLFSAARSGPNKLMLFWKRNGNVDRHEFYNVDANPTEQGHDISDEESETAEKLRDRLLSYLNSVDADRPKPAKKRKR